MVSRQSFYGAGSGGFGASSFDQFSPSSNRFSPSRGGTGAGYMSPQQPQYYRPSPVAASSPYSPSGPYYYQPTPAQAQQSTGFRKSDSFEPMNTSPTVQQQHSPSSLTRRLPSSPLQGSFYLPAFLTGESHHHHSPPLVRSRSLKELSSPNVSSSAKDQVELSPQKRAPKVVSKGPPVFGLGSSSELSPNASFTLASAAGGNGDGSAGKGTPPTQEEQQQQQILLQQQHQTSLYKSFTNEPLPMISANTSPPSPPVTSLWVTVYGFSVSATSYVISHFSQFGTITDSKSIHGANWIHLKFSNKFEVIKALNKSGTIIGGNMMIGVMAYKPGDDDEAIKAGAVRKSTSSVPDIQPLTREGVGGGMFSESGVGSSSSRQRIDPLVVQDVKSRLRPLARAGYVGTNPLPKQSNGIISRVFDYVFGW